LAKSQSIGGCNSFRAMPDSDEITLLRVFHLREMAITLGKGGSRHVMARVHSADLHQYERQFGINCVYLTCFAEAAEVWAVLLRSSGIRIHFADTLEKVEFLLIVTNATVLLSDALFLDGAWSDAASMVEHIFPGVQLVLVLDGNDYRARQDASENYAGDFIYKPLRITALHHGIEAGHKLAMERHSAAANVPSVTGPIFR